jgi:hypothetical protein
VRGIACDFSVFFVRDACDSIINRVVALFWGLFSSEIACDSSDQDWLRDVFGEYGEFVQGTIRRRNLTSNLLSRD